MPISCRKSCYIPTPRCTRGPRKEASLVSNTPRPNQKKSNNQRGATKNQQPPAGAPAPNPNGDDQIRVAGMNRIAAIFSGSVAAAITATGVIIAAIITGVWLVRAAIINHGGASSPVAAPRCRRPRLDRRRRRWVPPGPCRQRFPRPVPVGCAREIRRRDPSRAGRPPS